MPYSMYRSDLLDSESLSHSRLPRSFFKEFVYQRLVGLVTLRGQSAQAGQKLGGDTNRDQLLCASGLRPSDAPRASKLGVRRFRQIRKIDRLTLNRLRALSGLPDAQ